MIGIFGKKLEKRMIFPVLLLIDFHRYEEDFDIAKKLHHNVHRLSLEWSRIEPREGVFDEGAIQHYREV
jgi:beta-glucosidase/6-phospho-beta-glucosidase/beta-galactosidase